MLHHEGHELGGVATNTEEVEVILFHEGLKDGVGGNANAVTIGVPQYLAQGDERLDIATRADNLNDNVEAGRRLLARLTAEARRNIGGRKCSR